MHNNTSYFQLDQIIKKNLNKKDSRTKNDGIKPPAQGDPPFPQGTTPNYSPPSPHTHASTIRRQCVSTRPLRFLYYGKYSKKMVFLKK